MYMPHTPFQHPPLCTKLRNSRRNTTNTAQPMSITAQPTSITAQPMSITTNSSQPISTPVPCYEHHPPPLQVDSSAVDGNVTVVTADPAAATSPGGDAPSSGALPALQKRGWCGRWVVGSPEFHSQLVGAKSINTLAMSRRLPHWVRQPVSLALPFGTFEQTLEEAANARLAGEISARSRALKGLGPEALPQSLEEVRGLVMQLHSPEGLREMFRELCFDSNVCYPGRLSW